MSDYCCSCPSDFAVVVLDRFVSALLRSPADPTLAPANMVSGHKRRRRFWFGESMRSLLLERFLSDTIGWVPYPWRWVAAQQITLRLESARQ
jgi:hypothetical protein